jgi:hypothetical protein
LENQAFISSQAAETYFSSMFGALAKRSEGYPFAYLNYFGFGEFRSESKSDGAACGI